MNTVLLGGFLLAGTASASTWSNSQGALYWDTFSGLTNSNITWYENDSTAANRKTTYAESRIANNWFMDTNVVASAPEIGISGWGSHDRTTPFPPATASGYTTADSLNATVDVTTTLPGEILTADAASWRNGVFDVSNTGTYNFQIDYSFSQNLGSTLLPGSSSAYSYIYFQFFTGAWEWVGDNATGQWVWQWRQFGDPILHDMYNALADTIDSTSASPGNATYYFSKDLDAGQYYNFTAGVYTYAGADTSAVPIPGAAWLLGSGLVGILAIRKKFSS